MPKLYSYPGTCTSKHRGNSDRRTLAAVELLSCRSPGRQSMALVPMAHPDIAGIFLEIAGGLLLSSLRTHYVAIELCKTCKEYTLYYLFISTASVHLNFHASLCLHVIILYMYLNCCSCLWSWETKATLNSFSIIYFYKRTTVKINQRYAGFYCYFFNFGGYFPHIAAVLKLKRCTAEKVPWKYNPLHSRKINKQGHPNFQLVLVQYAGNGWRTVKGSLRLGRGYGTVTGRFEAGIQAQCEDGSSPRKTAC